MRIAIPIDEDELIADVKAGMTYTEIMKKHDCSHSVIYYRIRGLKDSGKLPEKAKVKRSWCNQYTESTSTPNFKKFDLQVGDKLKISKEMWTVDWIRRRVFGVSNGRKRESFQKKEYSIGLMEGRG